MDTNILNYRIVIEPETSTDGSVVYVAFCPTLGISDYGDTIEEVLASIQDGIELAVDCLVKEKKDVPVDNVTSQIMTIASIKAPKNAQYYLPA